MSPLGLQIHYTRELKVKSNKIEPIAPIPSKSQLLLISILQNKKRFLTIFISVVLLSFLAGLSYYMWNKTKTKNYSTNSQSLTSSSPLYTRSDFRKFKKIADRYPTLQPQLDSSLAQAYLNDGHIATSKSLISRVQKRQGPLLALVNEFNALTYLIEEHHYKEALEKGYVLKEKLKANPDFKTVYAIHLLRLVSLEQKLGHLAQKQSLLKEFLTLNAQESTDFNDSFTLGKLNIAQYLDNKELL